LPGHDDKVHVSPFTTEFGQSSNQNKTIQEKNEAGTKLSAVLATQIDKIGISSIVEEQEPILQNNVTSKLYLV